jgi:two-component system OmpR family response regulator
MTIRALLIDDDARLFELLSGYLGNNDVDVVHAPDGGRGLAELERQPYDVVLLDVMMPGMGGLEVLRRLRVKSAIPVVMLTAKGDETDRIVGLEMGADDYLPKPFNPRELLARIRAVLRRASPEVTGKTFRAGPFAIDVDARSVTRGDERLDLTGFEFDLLVALARRKGRVLDREALLREAGRGDVAVSERTVDVHVSHLRQKLGDDKRAPRFIKTVRGVGYVLADGEES